MDRADIRAEFTALRERTGLNSTQFARLLGYAGSSGTQNYEYPNGIHTDPHLPTALVKRMLKTLVGEGKPPIQEEEIVQLSALGRTACDRTGGGPVPAMTSKKFLQIVLMGDKAIVQKNLHPKLNEVQRGEIYHALIRTYYDEGDVDLRTAVGIVNALHPEDNENEKKGA